MNGTVKSKVLFLSVNLIAFTVLLQMGLYVTHQFWGLNIGRGIFQYCLTALEKNSIEHKIVEVLFYGLIAYTMSLIILQVTKQFYLTWKLERRLQGQQHLDSTRQINKKYQSLGTEIVVVTDDSFVAFAMGIFRPKIVLSTQILDQFTDQEVQAIVYHEWHHCHKHDPLKLFIVTVFTESMTYIPVLRGLAHHYKVWRELLADRYVMRKMSSVYELGSVLFKLTDLMKKRSVNGVSFADVAINYRIQQIIEPSKPIRIPVLHKKQSLLSVAVVMFLMSFILGGCA